MSVQIDRYELNGEQSPKILVLDKKTNSFICSLNTVNKEYNLALANILLDELNTGKYEEDDEVSP